MQPLYIAPTRFVKSANYQLSPTPANWLDEIFTYVVKEYPYLANYLPGDIDWKHGKTDIPKGIAVGEINLRSGENIITLPVIIRETELEPIDIFQHKDKFYLLTEKNVRQFLNNNDLGKPSIRNIYMRGYQNYVSPGELSYSGLMGKLSHKMDMATKTADLVNQLHAMNETDLARWLKSGGRKMLNGWVKDQEAQLLNSDGDATQSSVKLVTKSATQLMFREKHYHKGRLVKDAEIGVEKLANASPGIFMMPGYRRRNVVLKHTIGLFDKTAEEASTEKAYTLFDQSLNAHRGKFFDRRVLPFKNDPNPKDSGQKIFITESGYFAVDPQNYIEVDNQPQIPFKNGSEKIFPLAEEKTVAFRFKGTKGLFGPYYVEKDILDPNKDRWVILKDPVHGRIGICISDKFAEPALIRFTDSISLPKVNKAFVVPPIEQFVYLKHAIGTAQRSSVASYLQSTVEKKAESSVSLRKTSTTFSENLFSLYNGPVKIAHVGETEMKAVLMSMGAPSDMADLALKEAVVKPVDILNLALPETAKTANVDKYAARAMFRNIRPRIDSLLKSAMQLQETDMNPIFTLGLMDEEVVTDYVEALNVFESSLNYLAKLLHDVRLGIFPEISEQVVKSALMNLDTIVNALRSVKLN